MKASGIGDTVFFGPEAEFFIFDDVKFKADPYNTGFSSTRSSCPPTWTPTTRAATSATASAPRAATSRSRRSTPPRTCAPRCSAPWPRWASSVEKHHHEVASAQHELGMKFDTLTLMADHLQIYKYCIHNVAHSYGKTATFMPKPIYGDNGSGMHCHQSIWKDGKPLFAGNEYADLSESACTTSAASSSTPRRINAFTNPLTNSYKRLVPGFEAPVLLAYSSRNRSASCRIPYTTNPKAKRVEVRFPDPAANPYLAFAAMLMAGLDGIKNKIHPGDPMDKNLYDLPPKELKSIPTVCGSLREALQNLDEDRAFLTAGDVFTDDLIDSYIELKMEEVMRFEMTPHPVEFDMYYSV